MGTSEQLLDAHWMNTLTSLFHRTTKGLKIFRKVFNYIYKVKINYNKDRWISILKTNRICESEILAGYRNMQTRNFPRQLLDFKTRLLMGKTQFGKTLAKWSPLNVSQGCKVCLRQGHFHYDDLSHRLLTCPTSKIIIKHIQVTLTKQKFVTPVHMLLTNLRCIHKVNMLGKMDTDPIKVHSHCATYTKDKLYTMLSFTYIWDNYLMYIMQCSNNDSEPTRAQALQYILTEIKNFTRAMPENPVCIELIKIVQNMDKQD